MPASKVTIRSELLATGEMLERPDLAQQQRVRILILSPSRKVGCNVARYLLFAKEAKDVQFILGDGLIGIVLTYVLNNSEQP